MLVAAMEDAPAAIYCLGAVGAEPVWANARARALGTARGRAAGRRRPAGRRPASTRCCDRAAGDGLRPAGRPAGRRRRSWSGPCASPAGPAPCVVVESDDAATDTSRGRTAGRRGGAGAALPAAAVPADAARPARSPAATTGPPRSQAAGGDWYDAVPLGSGRVALVVGDAVGHGVPAAGAMSRLRGRHAVDGAARPVARRRARRAGRLRRADGRRRGRLGLLRRARRRAPATSPTPPRATRRRWSSAPTAATTFLPVTPRPPLGSLPGAPTPVSPARARAGRDAGAVLQRRRRRRRRRRVRRALDRLADVAADGAGRPRARCDADGRDELAAAIAEGVRSRRGLARRRRRPGRAPARRPPRSRCSWT